MKKMLTKKGMRRYTGWMGGYKPNKIMRIKIPLNVVNNNLELVYLGKCIRVNYESDKFVGFKRKYTHPFKRPSNMYTNPEGNILIISPCRITKRGIIQ